ncbi:MAG: HNH endonuclease [Lachnospiraceae bacterium]|nr:HNH endonuclease [Lachnospiraceae bacterium]
MANNPRSANGNRRRKHRARMKAMGLPCGICGGRFGPIHYDEPSDSDHPLSFVIDEIRPVSRWKQFGYASPEAAAADWNNLQPAHYYCNSAKSNRIQNEFKFGIKSDRKPSVKDGQW